MAFIFIWYIDLFALQHIVDRPGEFRTYDAHQYMRAQGPNAQSMDSHDLNAKLNSLTLVDS